MKTLKWIFFLMIFTLSSLFLFPSVSLKFMLFHLTLIFIFFFPYYFWVYSIKTLLIAVFSVFILAFLLFFALQKLPEKTLNLNLPSPVMGIEPEVSKVFFQFSKKNYAYDFEEKSLITEKESLKAPLIIDSPIFKEYQKKTGQWIKKFALLPVSFSSASVLLWIFSSVLIAFIFSYKTSLLVSYSNIIFMIPYTLFAAENFYFKPASPIMLAFQGGFFIILLIFSFIRVRH